MGLLQTFLNRKWSQDDRKADQAFQEKMYDKRRADELMDQGQAETNKISAANFAEGKRKEALKTFGNFIGKNFGNPSWAQSIAAGEAGDNPEVSSIVAQAFLSNVLQNAAKNQTAADQQNRDVIDFYTRQGIPSSAVSGLSPLVASAFGKSTTARSGLADLTNLETQAKQSAMAQNPQEFINSYTEQARQAGIGNRATEQGINYREQLQPFAVEQANVNLLRDKDAALAQRLSQPYQLKLAETQAMRAQQEQESPLRTFGGESVLVDPTTGKIKGIINRGQYGTTLRPVPTKFENDYSF